MPYDDKGEWYPNPFYVNPASGSFRAIPFVTATTMMPLRESTAAKLDRAIAETLRPEHVTPSGVSLLDLLPSGNLGL